MMKCLITRDIIHPFLVQKTRRCPSFCWFRVDNSRFLETAATDSIRFVCFLSQLGALD